MRRILVWLSLAYVLHGVLVMWFRRATSTPRGPRADPFNLSHARSAFARRRAARDCILSLREFGVGSRVCDSVRPRVARLGSDDPPRARDLSGLAELPVLSSRRATLRLPHKVGGQGAREGQAGRILPKAG